MFLAQYVNNAGEEFFATSCDDELDSEVIHLLLSQICDNSGESNVSIDDVYVYECKRKLIRAVTTYTVI